MNPEILKFVDASIARPSGDPVLTDLNWTVNRGEAWGLCGPTASGKSTLAATIYGRHRLTAGEMFLDTTRIGYVSFREESHQFSHSRHYYQQRFNFIEAEDDLTLSQFLGTEGVASNPLLIRLGIADLLDRSLIKLSNGQLRRSRLCKALLSHPELLILDEPFMGIDATGREELSEVLEGLHRDGITLILIGKRSELPSWVTQVFELRSREPSEPGASATGVLRQTPTPVADAPGSPVSDDEPIIELDHVNVQYSGVPILNDVSWRVLRGERWGLLGPNGSGKTTLLSLIAGDHPQVYANEVKLFGNQRGQGETIWEIKARIGILSPEIHLYFSEPLLAWEVVASGYFDVLVRRKISPERELRLREWFDQFGIASLRNRPFRQLSTGQQRLLLFLRAIVKEPELLILDEPFQGLDGETSGVIRNWIDVNLKPEQTLIFVTHRLEEMPRTIGSVLRLERGRTI